MQSCILLVIVFSNDLVERLKIAPAGQNGGALRIVFGPIGFAARTQEYCLS